MKKFLKIALILVVVIFAVLQFFRPSFTNPPIVAGQAIEDSLLVPAEVQMVLSRSCNDCHSNKTIYPWYSQVSPFSWFLAGHIEEGRHELNLSEWNTYSDNKKARKLEEICEMVESGSMPLPSYLWIHRDAGLSSEQKGLICSWSKAERAKFPAE
jgi:hypothetical protein